MSEIVNRIVLEADYFILMLFRVGALVITSPIFGRVNIPVQVRVALLTALSFLFFTAVPQQVPIVYNSLVGFALICASEILLGVALAYVTNVFFTLTFVAGQMIDMQIGFGIVNVYDIQNNTQIPMVGNVMNVILLIVFFMVDGHHRLIQILYITLDRLPVGNLVFSPDIGLVALEVFALSFLLGVTIALPIIGSGLVLEFAFGMLIRTVPQMNMFVIGIPIKLFAGFLMLFAIVPAFVYFSNTIFSEMFSSVERMFATFLAAS